MRPPLSWMTDPWDEPLPIQRTVISATLSSKESHMSSTYILTKTGGEGAILCLPQPPVISNQSMSKAFSLETPTIMVKSSDSGERLPVFKSQAHCLLNE